EKEMEILASNGTAVVHNPQSNLNNAVGIADIIKMQGKGILVGLGTDAMTVNMLEELRVALWAQHISNANPSCGFMESAGTLLRNNSIIAGRYWNVPLGEIIVGGAADIVLIDYIPPTPLDGNTYLGHIIFGISQSTVDTTIANGKVLMGNKVLTLNIDEEEISRKAREHTVALWNKF
ncbi:chlorohydrolase, partial [bacterium]